MGFHVRLAEDSQQLIRLIKTDPSKVVGRLYSAYLLFLIGDRDEEQLKWLIDSAKALDSLTGRHVAYAVFAKSFPVRLSTDSFPDDRAPTNVGQAPAEILADPASVTRLVQDGKFGKIVDGDEITAITYGTDLVARELGLIGKLPCLVVVDAVPANHTTVVQLDADVTASLFSLLRSAIARFQSTGGDTVVSREAQRILEIQAKIGAENERHARIRSAIVRERGKLEKLRAKITTGQQTSDPNFLKNIAEDREKVIASLVLELESFPADHQVKLQEYELELDEATRQYHRHADKLFSKCFATEIFAHGMKSKMGVAKTQSMTFLGGLFKPEVLLKVWGAIHQ